MGSSRKRRPSRHPDGPLPDVEIPADLVDAGPKSGPAARRGRGKLEVQYMGSVEVIDGVKHYSAVSYRGAVFKAGMNLRLEAGKNEEWVACARSFFQKGKIPAVRGVWYYTRANVEEAGTPMKRLSRRPSLSEKDLEHELLVSDHVDDNNLETVVGRCYVMTRTDWRRGYAAHKFLYWCSHSYNPYLSEPTLIKGTAVWAPDVRAIWKPLIDEQVTTPRKTKAEDKISAKARTPSKRDTGKKETAKKDKEKKETRKKDTVKSPRRTPKADAEQSQRATRALPKTPTEARSKRTSQRVVGLGSVTPKTRASRSTTRTLGLGSITPLPTKTVPLRPRAEPATSPATGDVTRRTTRKKRQSEVGVKRKRMDAGHDKVDAESLDDVPLAKRPRISLGAELEQEEGHPTDKDLRAVANEMLETMPFVDPVVLETPSKEAGVAQEKLSETVTAMQPAETPLAGKTGANEVAARLEAVHVTEKSDKLAKEAGTGVPKTAPSEPQGATVAKPVTKAVVKEAEIKEAQPSPGPTQPEGREADNSDELEGKLIIGLDEDFKAGYKGEFTGVENFEDSEVLSGADLSDDKPSEPDTKLAESVLEKAKTLVADEPLLKRKRTLEIAKCMFENVASAARRAERRRGDLSRRDIEALFESAYLRAAEALEQPV